MAAIITTKFRYKNAANLLSALSGTGTDKYYLFIGRSFPWPSDSSPPSPADTQFGEYDTQSNILALKKLAATNLTRAIPRYNWISGEAYSEYDDQDSALSTKQYYVVTDELSVYKCIKAGPGGSLIKPTGSSTGIGNILADGYQWKYMYTLSGASVAKFNTSSFIAVETLEADDDSIQWDVQQAAIPGGIHRIKILSGGNGYTTKPTVTITGDGQDCTVVAAGVTIAGGAVTEVLINNPGMNYTRATVSFSGGTSGTVATARAIISPKGGHGSNPVDELGAFYVMADVQLVADEGSGDFLVDNDFRQIGIVVNPKEVTDASGDFKGTWATAISYTAGDVVNYNNTIYTCDTNHTSDVFATDLIANYWIASDVATSSTLNALSYVTYTSLVGTLSKDTTMIGATSAATAYVDSVETSASKIKFHQNSTTGFKNFQVGESITIGSATAVIASIHTAEYEPMSGQLVYVENLAPVNRNISQTEDIKLVLEL
jgi:hypothetical protein